MQAQQGQEQAAVQADAENQKHVLMRKILTPEARQRLHNIRMVRPDFAQQLEIQLLQIAQSGKVQLPMDDDLLKKLLSQIQSQQSKRDISIRRL